MSTLRDLKVASKLFAGFGIVCLLLAAVVALGISRLGDSQANLTTVSTSGISSVQSIGIVKNDFSAMRFSLLNAVLAPEAASHRGGPDGDGRRRRRSTTRPGPPTSAPAPRPPPPTAPRSRT